MPLNICKECGSSSLDIDTAKGQVVCTVCGEVNEATIVVSDPTYEDNGHGGSSMIGTFVSANSTGAGGLGEGFRGYRHGINRSSKEITFEKIRREINDRGKQMKMEQHNIDKAFNIYKLAFEHRLTKGRRNDLVIAASLYITCRCDGGNSQYLMIDFSEHFGVDIYELGRTFMHFTKSLNFTLNSIDPCLYIIRFASRMQFGKQTTEVSNTAMRLVQRMKKDHLHVGRRPSGLCGAALLFAARHHGFNRKPADVVRIVKVHESTLRKRMIEFGETPSSLLSFEDFMAVDLEEEQDPPAYKDARRRDRQRREIEKQAALDGIEGEQAVYEVSELRQQIERLLNDKKGGRANSEAPEGNKRKRTATESSLCEFETDIEDSAIQRVIDESTMTSVVECINSSSLLPTTTPVNQELIEGPTLAMMGLGERPSEPQEPLGPKQPESGELEFDDLDDDELNYYILSGEERIIKYRQWMAENEDYVRAQEEKAAQEEKDRLEGKPEKKKRKAPRKKNATAPCSTAGEAIEKMLKEKKLSQKINYDALKQLREGASTSATPVEVKGQALASATLMPPPSSRGVVPRRIQPKVEPKIKQEPKRPVKEEIPAASPQPESAEEDNEEEDEDEVEESEDEEQLVSIHHLLEEQQQRYDDY
ncbi:transcription factor IIIB 90 kDa subunit [Neocloeon triangulifer]|uniref:transcription factor IIIB 90 kDa subunit n=1 Tax=Neocloeon triangulifer TaxID=2078957 RepID=UPI00286F8EFC|nr:transcription factor IIIB 90 kDa subunit [Neocloeon triangulifer]